MPYAVNKATNPFPRLSFERYRCGMVSRCRAHVLIPSLQQKFYRGWPSRLGSTTPLLRGSWGPVAWQRNGFARGRAFEAARRMRPVDRSRGKRPGACAIGRAGIVCGHAVSAGHSGIDSLRHCLIPHGYVRAANALPRAMEK